MGEAERQDQPNVSARAHDDGPRDPDEIQADIEQAREELGETVAAVADKADVKKQAKAKVAETRQQAKAKVTDMKDNAAQAGQQASAKVQDATPASIQAGARHASQEAVHVARENPVPSAVATGFLAGLVVGLWLRRG